MFVFFSKCEFLLMVSSTILKLSSDEQHQKTFRAQRKKKRLYYSFGVFFIVLSQSMVLGIKRGMRSDVYYFHLLLPPEIAPAKIFVFATV